MLVAMETRSHDSIYWYLQTTYDCVRRAQMGEGRRGGTVMRERRETVRSKRRRTGSSGTEREKENIIGGTQKLRKEEGGVRH